MPRKRGVYGTSPPSIRQIREMHSAFGTWLSRYKGRNPRVHQLKAAFNERRIFQKWPPGKFRNANAVYSILVTGDCLPEWGPDLLRQCETCWKAGRYELSALEQLRFLHPEHYSQNTFDQSA